MDLSLATMGCHMVSGLLKEVPIVKDGYAHF